MLNKLSTWAFSVCFACLFVSSISAQDWAVEEILPRARPNVTEHYGMDVAGHGNFVAIGVPGNTESGYKQGYVQILEQTTSGVIELAKLRPTRGLYSTIRAQNFGFTVAMDENKVAVLGNYNEPTDSKFNRPVIYLFERPESGWADMTETAVLTLPETQSSFTLLNYNTYGDLLIEEDLIVLGVPFEDDPGSGNGAVYVFEKPEEGWQDMTHTFKIRSPYSSYAFFGSSMDIDGNTLVVGNDAKEYVRSYPIVIYERTADSWEQVATISNHENDSYGFAKSVGLQDDHLFVNSYRNAGSGQTPRINVTMFVIKKGENGWSDETERVPMLIHNNFPHDISQMDIETSDNAVLSVINRESFLMFDKPEGDWVSGYYNRGTQDYEVEAKYWFVQNFSLTNDYIYIGEPSSSVVRAYNGSVTRIEKTGSTWSEPIRSELFLPSGYATSAYQQFGHEIDVEDDIMVVAGYNAGGHGSNNVAVYEKTTDGSRKLGELMLPDENMRLYYGYRVSIHNDVIAIGAYTIPSIYNPYINTTSGKVYVFEKPGGGWQDMEPTATLSPSTPKNKDGFGASIAQSENEIVIGALAQGDYGEVFVYNKPEDGWADMTESQRISPTRDYLHRQRFGDGVALNGDELVISGFGLISVYQKNSNGTWRHVAELFGENPPNFPGHKMVYKNNTLIASVPGHNFGTPTSTGRIEAIAAYVYEKPETGWVDRMLPTTILIPSDSSYGFSDVDFDEEKVVLYAGNYQEDSHVHLFYRPENGWGESGEPYFHQDTALFAHPTGGSVALDDKSIYVGNPRHNANGDQSGVVTVYTDISVVTSTGDGFVQSPINEIKVYPNPATDYLWLSYDRPVKVLSYSIVDSSGTILSTNTIDSFMRNVRVDISGLKPGIYVLSLADEFGTKPVKFMVLD